MAIRDFILWSGFITSDLSIKYLPWTVFSMPEAVLSNAKDFAGTLIENEKKRQEANAIGFKCIS